PSANQNNLNRPNGILHEGDRFGYDYDIHIQRVATWVQGVFRFNKFDFFAAGEVSGTRFFREGNVKNGLFPNNSFGVSKVNKFQNQSVKAGVTYKFNGRNYIYANGAYMTRAPFFENAYISPRTRDVQQDNLVNETIKSVEGGYIMNAPSLKVRLSGYYTTFEDGLNVLSFYHDEYRNLVNYALSNIDKVHYGGEFGFEAKVAPGLTMNGAAAVKVRVSGIEWRCEQYFE
ncbi:MAG: TonB-dependent receptor, partial [Chitinophagaceae bacterium]